MAVIEEFLPQILAEQKMDADPTPRTLTYMLLAEGRLEEAESAARQTVAESSTDDVRNLVRRV